MEYQVLSPWAEVDAVPVKGLQPRVSDLGGKTIGLFAGFKEHWVLILREVERQLREKFPTAKFSHFQYPKDCVHLTDDDEYMTLLEEWLKGVDTVISGHGDAASCALFLASNTAAIEKLNKPVVMMLNKDMVNIARTGASVSGVPGLRLVLTTILDLSGLYSFDGVEENIIRPGVTPVIDDIVTALTKPLTSEEESPTKEVEKPTRIVSKGNLEEVNTFFYKSGWAYGMPVMPPTEEAVREMLTGTDLPTDHVVAKIPPMNGKATVEKIAINAVMAGCLPSYMPVLIAAVQAAVDFPKLKPGSSLEGYTCSVASWAPLLIINGPIRRDLHVNSGVAVLSPYYRANTAIGHALGLIILNIGGTRPGMEDLSHLGHEGRSGVCIGENEEESPWEPLHVEYGFDKKDSTVTLFWPNSRSFIAIDSSSSGTILRDICNNISTFGWDPGGALLMLPSAARALASEGWTRKEVMSYILEYSRKPATEFNLRWFRGNHHLVPGMILPADPTRSMRRVSTPGNLRIVVAGGEYKPGAILYGDGCHGGPVIKKVELPATWDELVNRYKDIVPTYTRY